MESQSISPFAEQSPPAALDKHGMPADHFVTAGEKKFDRRTYTDIGYIINALLSVFAVAWVERTHSGQGMMRNFRNWAKQNVRFIPPETAEMLATKSFFLTGGFAVLAPMKWLEDDKPKLVKKWNREIYGPQADKDPKILRSEQELEQGPKQSWKSIFASRALALLPFYAGYWLLWGNKGPLAKATNSELGALSKNAIKVMEEHDPSKLAQIASKGVYIDRPIAAASRWIGKGLATLTGNKAALSKLEEAEKSFPGTILSLKQPHAVGDPLHSVAPYYVISEAITSGMVAWGVFALTRITGPFFDKKSHPDRPVPWQPAASEIRNNAATSPARKHAENLMANMMGSLGDYGSKTVAKAIANGAKIVPYQPKPGQEDLGGYYDAASNSVYVNSTRPPERQANVLVHESQHANNLLEGTILTKEAALAKGEEAYIVNFLQDEARAHAAGFIYAHQTQDRHELDSHATQALFKDVAYNGADDAAFARYSAAALKQLENGALGYRERAHESFAARSKEQEQHVEKTPAPKKHEQPSTEIELSGLEHALTHELEHFAHK